MCIFLLECVKCHCMCTYVGSSPCRNYSLLGIAHPVVEPPFRYRECTGRQRSDKAVIIKEADVWPLYYLCKKCFV